MVACIYIYYHTNHNTLRHLRQNLRQMKHCDHKNGLLSKEFVRLWFLTDVVFMVKY